MSKNKKELTLYLFVSKGGNYPQMISTKRLKSLKGLLPTEVDLVRRLFISESMKVPYEPFEVRLTEEQGKEFVDEICSKSGSKTRPHNMLFLHPTNPFYPDCSNLGVAKIVIDLPKKEK